MTNRKAIIEWLAKNFLENPLEIDGTRHDVDHNRALQAAETALEELLDSPGYPRKSERFGLRFFVQEHSAYDLDLPDAIVAQVWNGTSWQNIDVIDIECD